MFIPAGIKDACTVSPDRTLGDFGLDSLMGVQIRQTLDRDYDISMSAKEIRALTFAKLDQLSASTSQSAASKAVSQAPSSSIHYDLRDLCPSEAVVEMNNLETEASPLFVIPPVDGSVVLLSTVMSKIQTAKVYGFQCTDYTPLTSIPDLASHYIKVDASVFLLFLRVSAMLKHVLAIGWTSVRPSVCLSVTCWYCIKTAEHIVMLSSLHYRDCPRGVHREKQNVV